MLQSAFEKAKNSYLQVERRGKGRGGECACARRASVRVSPVSEIQDGGAVERLLRLISPKTRIFLKQTRVGRSSLGQPFVWSVWVILQGLRPVRQVKGAENDRSRVDVVERICVYIGFWVEIESFPRYVSECEAPVHRKSRIRGKLSASRPPPPALTEGKARRVVSRALASQKKALLLSNFCFFCVTFSLQGSPRDWQRRRGAGAPVKGLSRGRAGGAVPGMPFGVSGRRGRPQAQATSSSAPGRGEGGVEGGGWQGRG